METRDIVSVSDNHLCCGCGACAWFARGAVEMVDVPEEGRRPRVCGVTNDNVVLMEAVNVCPGIGLSHQVSDEQDGVIQELLDAWGPIREIWEGSATDAEVRFAGSSGGAATAIALYCIEQAGMHGVLHTAAQKDVPYLNETVMSRTRDELMAATGSRYAPASPCDGLQQIEDAPGPCVFVGKPCDVAATRKARQCRPVLDKKFGLTIAFFCAGTPSTRGTLEMLRRMGIEDTSSLVSLRYRGNGWPGKATAVVRTEDGLETRQLTYEQSWGEVLSSYQQWRCKVCADHTGEFADIAVGDPWYRPVQAGEPGQSLILARTHRGLEFVEAAARAGYLTIVKAEPSILPRSQPNLLRTRGAVWGRILACRLMGVVAPQYRRMPLFKHWCNQLTLSEKLRSILGTARRIIRGR